ncbi:MAG: hypothetical protein JJU24_02355 [Natronohydrobacter sp.]|nr:hypothetical protein [Natronohydrobacter sp.]
MSLIRIRAADTAKALAEVERRFGEDAMIVSTSRDNGEVEIVITQSAELAQAPLSTEMSQPDAHALPLPSRLVLIGPPGAGVSMLAARLAAYWMRHEPSVNVQLIAPRPDPLAPVSPLVAHARLLGLSIETPNWTTGQPGQIADTNGHRPQIVDLSGLGQDGPFHVAPLLGGASTACWLVLPTGLHRQAQDTILAVYRPLCSALALTRADLCPLTLEDRALPYRFGLPIALVAQGVGLLDACRMQNPTRPMSAQYKQKDNPHVAARLSG